LLWSVAVEVKRQRSAPGMLSSFLRCRHLRHACLFGYGELLRFLRGTLLRGWKAMLSQGSTAARIPKGSQVSKSEQALGSTVQAELTTRNFERHQLSFQLAIHEVALERLIGPDEVMEFGDGEGGDHAVEVVDRRRRDPGQVATLSEDRLLLRAG